MTALFATDSGPKHAQKHAKSTTARLPWVWRCVTLPGLQDSLTIRMPFDFRSGTSGRHRPIGHSIVLRCTVLAPFQTVYGCTVSYHSKLLDPYPHLLLSSRCRWASCFLSRKSSNYSSALTALHKCGVKSTPQHLVRSPGPTNSGMIDLTVYDPLRSEQLKARRFYPLQAMYLSFRIIAIIWP